jgi:hypothetical protein
LTTKAKIDLGKIDVSLDVPTRFELSKERVRDPQAMQALDDYIDVNNSKKAYRRNSIGFAAILASSDAPC